MAVVYCAANFLMMVPVYHCMAAARSANWSQFWHQLCSMIAEFYIFVSTWQADVLSLQHTLAIAEVREGIEQHLGRAGGRLQLLTGQKKIVSDLLKCTQTRCSVCAAHHCNR